MWGASLEQLMGKTSYPISSESSAAAAALSGRGIVCAWMGIVTWQTVPASASQAPATSTAISEKLTRRTSSLPLA